MKQLQRELRGGRGSLPPPHLEGPRETQRSTAQIQHHQVNAVDAVEGLDPVGKFAELARLFQAGEIHQQFQSGAPRRLLCPHVLQHLKGVLTHHPAKLPGVPGRMVEEATDG